MSEQARAANSDAAETAQQPGPIVRFRLRGPGVARVITLGMYPATIGSEKGCSVRVPLEGLAARHLRIECRAGRELVAVDLGEASGEAPAKHNGRPIDKPTPLFDRDLLHLGPLELQAFLPARTRGPMVGSPKVREEARAGLLLEGLEEPIFGRLVRLPTEIDVPMTIGRAKHTSFTISHPRVSGEHAVILLRAGGTHIIVDKGSRNGTAVNGRPVEPHEATPLAAGDLLEIGPIAMLVKSAREVPRTMIGTIEAGRFVVKENAGKAQKADPTEPQGTVPPAVKRKLADALEEAQQEDQDDADLFEPPPGAAPLPPPPKPKRQARPSTQSPPSTDVASASSRDAHPPAFSDPGESEGDISQPVPPPDPEVAAQAAKRFRGEPVTGPMLVGLAEPGKHNAPERFPLPMSTVLIGRVTSADLVLAVPSISSAHCQIEPIGQGREFVLRDADSANGVYVNDARVQRHVLRHLDVIRVGPVKYLYVAPGRPFPSSMPGISDEFDTRRLRPQQKRAGVAVPSPLRDADRKAVATPKQVAEAVAASAAATPEPDAAQEEPPSRSRRPVLFVLVEMLSVTAAVLMLTVLGLAYAEVLPPIDQFWSLLLESLERTYGLELATP